jgi:hypothetical protein
MAEWCIARIAPYEFNDVLTVHAVTATLKLARWIKR